mmetsp:Transcript_57155/g.110353  ORF Transcript_57155/g.110353 Transcript_57155/m.110353 type:complete len:157 (+) Transcript_57155:43-513(+)
MFSPLDREPFLRACAPMEKGSVFAEHAWGNPQQVLRRKAGLGQQQLHQQDQQHACPRPILRGRAALEQQQQQRQQQQEELQKPWRLSFLPPVPRSPGEEVFKLLGASTVNRRREDKITTSDVDTFLKNCWEKVGLDPPKSGLDEALQRRSLTVVTL